MAFRNKLNERERKRKGGGVGGVRESEREVKEKKRRVWQKKKQRKGTKREKEGKRETDWQEGLLQSVWL